MSRIFKEYPDVVTIDQMQRMLHIGRNTAYGLLKSGAIPSVRAGKKYIIPKTDVVAFAKGKK